MSRQAAAPWWLADGSEICTACTHLYAYHMEFRCVACDRGVCCHCVSFAVTTHEALCPECAAEEAG